MIVKEVAERALNSQNIAVSPSKPSKIMIDNTVLSAEETLFFSTLL
jgi:hypothetical protein